MKSPKTTVAAIIHKVVNGEKQILLTQRSAEPYKNKWCLPGGHIDPDEKAESAVIREVREETGLDYSPNFYRYVDEIIPEKDIHAVVLVFEGMANGTLKLQEEEVKNAKWLNHQMAMDYDFAFEHRGIVGNYLMEDDQ